MQGCLGLVGIIVIGALIVNSGVGNKIMGGLNQLEGDCYNALGQVGHGVASAACPAVGSAVRGVDSVATSIGDALRNFKESVLQKISDQGSGSAALQGYMQQLSGSMNIPGLESLMSSSQDLLAKMQRGPQGIASGASMSDQLRSALDSFSIGQHYLDDGSVSQALPWLQQGAAAPGGYGLLSQMMLGNMYSQGAGGMAANPNAAIQYYSQSLQSITRLQQNGSPQALHILSTLPASPQQIQQQLQEAIGQLKQGR